LRRPKRSSIKGSSAPEEDIYVQGAAENLTVFKSRYIENHQVFLPHPIYRQQNTSQAK
jgi:hypothetical protein